MNVSIKFILPFLISFGFSVQAFAKTMKNIELNGFKNAVENTQYVAKIKITKIETFNEDDGLDKHVYSAKVLATYKGKELEQINYHMFVERGEDAVFNSTPVYIALCVDSEGRYYWPGTGSQFATTDMLKAWLIKNDLNNMDSTESWCN
jgi:hypothetical protein